jgi:hypothetical protein
MLFKNPFPNQGYDGNVYGLLLNVNGVVINDFLKSRPSGSIGNQHIYLQNIDISNIISRPVEVIAISPDEIKSDTNYGGTRQVGPFGDVLDINSISDSLGKYKTNNVLSNAQIFVAKLNKKGTSTITQPIVQWSENKTQIQHVMIINKYYYVKGGDSMGHIMKGNIGFFISAGENIIAENLSVTNVCSKGQWVDNVDLIKKAKGGNARGIVVSGSSNINLNNPKIDNITTENPKSNALNIETIN